MATNSTFMPSRLANYKLSSSYPNVKPLNSNQLNCNGSFSFNSHTKSWSNYQNIALKTADSLRIQDMTYNSDLQPLNWLQKESIIDIDPLDIEEDMKDDESATPGYDDLINPQITLARVEVESQENSNIHDFVRFQAMRNSMNNNSGSNGSGNRVALRSNNSFSDCTQNYSHQASGFVKPNLSYTQLIFMAIETCKDRAMTVNDIYQWCEVNYPYYKHIGPSWKNSLRHNLSINKSFRRMPRDGQQGGPGRGAYWVVDDKERKNLLDSIYRAHQAMPLADRNGTRGVDSPPYSLFMNTPAAKHGGPMLRIDGRFTDASTYLQSKRTDDEVAANENHLIQGHAGLLDSAKLDAIHPGPVAAAAAVPAALTDRTDIEYASMMYNLGANSSPDVGDASLKLSASYNSTSSRLEDGDGGGDCQKPRVKSRRKSKHDKVRNYSECAADSTSGSHPSRAMPFSGGHGGTTSVNVIIAPHFDHIYARYQQFLRPAIPSDMDTVQLGASGIGGPGNEPDVEFLRRGSHSDRDYEEEEEDDGQADEREIDDEHDCGERRLVVAMDASLEVKCESKEPPEAMLRRMAMISAHNGGTRRVRLSQASVAFTRKRKVQRVLARRSSRRSVRRGPTARHQKRDRDPGKRHSLRSASSRAAAVARRVKREPLEPAVAAEDGAAGESALHCASNGDDMATAGPGSQHDNEGIHARVHAPTALLSKAAGSPAEAVRAGAHRDEDGYRTDSTMPMVVAARRRNGRTAAGRLLTPVRRKQTGSGTAGSAGAVRGVPVPEKRCRSKRKRTRPLRIDESAERAAIEFLASLEQRQQKCRRSNLENLYKFNAFLNSSLGTTAAAAAGGDSCSSSSVVLVSE